MGGRRGKTKATTRLLTIKQKKLYRVIMAGLVDGDDVTNLRSMTVLAEDVADALVQVAPTQSVVEYVEEVQLIGRVDVS